MNKTKLIIKIICFIIIIVFGFLMIISLFYRYTPPPSIISNSRLTKLSYVFEYIIKNNKKNIIKNLLSIKKSDSFYINKKILSIFREVPETELLSELFKHHKVEEMTEGNDFLCDAWGNPLCFMLPDSAELYKLHPALRRWELPDLLEWNNEVREEDKLYPTIKEGWQIIFFWSAGENKINEFGYGDDVIAGHKKGGGSKELRLLRKTYFNALYSLKNDIDDSDRNKLTDVESLRFILREKGILRELQAYGKYGENTVLLNPNIKQWFSALEQNEDTKEQVKSYSDFAIILESKGYFFGVRFDGSGGAEGDMPDVPLWARKWEIESGLKNDE